MLAPPHEPQTESPDLEALIREARERQRRRRTIVAAAAAVVAAAAALSVWAAVPSGRSASDAGHGGFPGATGGPVAPGRGRVPIVEVGSNGGVTWAINGLGMWLTQNGGRTWRRSAPPHVRDMGDLIARVEQVDFLDKSSGWLLAVDVRGGLRPGWVRHAELDWTRDGGRTWHWTIPDGCCGQVSFLTPSRGWFLGRSQLFATSDGGSTWTRAARTPFSYGTPTFVDARHGVAVVPKTGLYRTADGGRRWRAVRLAGRPDVLPNVAAFGKRLVVPAERAAPDPRLVVYVSEDGGATWQARPAPAWWTPLIGSNDASEFSAASSTVWFAAGWRKLAVSTDAGRSWRQVRVDLPPRWTIAGISFTSPRTGWAIFQQSGAAAARRSVLMRTTDGGRHWTAAGPRRRAHRG